LSVIKLSLARNTTRASLYSCKDESESFHSAAEAAVGDGNSRSSFRLHCVTLREVERYTYDVVSVLFGCGEDGLEFFSSLVDQVVGFGLLETARGFVTCEQG
jgi:hypothetical protein